MSFEVLPVRKKNIVYHCFLLVILFLHAASFAYAEPENNRTQNLTVGVPKDRCPIFYQDAKTGEIVGIGIDLMRLAAKKAGYTATFTFIDEVSLKAALDNPAYDVIMPFGSAVTSAKGKASAVTENLFQTPFTLVTVNNQKLLSLNELRVGMLTSLAGGAETVSQLYPGARIIFYETMHESVQALRAGKVDALLHNSYVWSYTLQKPAYADLSVQPLTMFSMDFRAGVIDSPAGQTLIKQLNEGIATLTDTQKQAIILDYTSRKLYQNDFFDYIYQYGLFLLLGILLAISLIVIVIQRMRTLQLEHEEKMHRLINTDSLTGILSLNGFRKRVEELLRLHPDKPYIIAYSNIRNLKYLNESLGMEAGNELLLFWTERMLSYLTDADALGRIEADHFAILRHLEGEEQFSEDIKNVFDPVRNFFINRNTEIRVQISSGIYALTPADYQKINVDQMLDFARVAEKRLRDNHKEGLEFYNTEQWKTGKMIADMINHFPAAIQTEEIQIWYQPQVDFVAGKIMGAEALCRWKIANRGWISPTEFIPALEEAGLIYDLDCYVWERVCKDLQRWNNEGKHRSVSVNLSRADFLKSSDIPEHFNKLIKTYELSPDQLHIEITETAYVENSELLISTTQRLRKYGFQVEMDDFGSGYSSLNMLKEVQVDRIKLDLHFLTETGAPKKGRIIIEHIIKMAQALGMKLIAEGVECEEQARFLKELGCTEMQGFFFHKPMPTADFESLLEAGE